MLFVQQHSFSVLPPEKKTHTKHRIFMALEATSNILYFNTSFIWFSVNKQSRAESAYINVTRSITHYREKERWRVRNNGKNCIMGKETCSWAQQANPTKSRMHIFSEATRQFFNVCWAFEQLNRKKKTTSNGSTSSSS